MEVIITKIFTKQYLRCPGNVQDAVKAFITSLEKAKSLREISEIKKLSGFKNYYRVCIGQDRIGVKEQKPKVILMAVMERPQIYKSFPSQ